MLPVARDQIRTLKSTGWSYSFFRPVDPTTISPVGRAATQVPFSWPSRTWWHVPVAKSHTRTCPSHPPLTSSPVGVSAREMTPAMWPVSVRSRDTERAAASYW